MSEKFLVRDYMASPATTLQQTNSLLDAALLLRSTGFRHLPIVDGEQLVGLITERDVSRLAPSMLGKVSPEEYNAIFQNTPLEKVMTRNPTTVTPETGLLEAATILHNKKLGCLPVVESGRLIGIITLTDMLGLLVHLLGGKVPTGFELEEA